MTTMIRMKENVIRHQYISTTNIRDDISTQYNIVICICYIAYVCVRIRIVLEWYRDGGIVEGVGVDALYSAAFGIHSTRVKNIL